MTTESKSEHPKGLVLKCNNGAHVSVHHSLLGTCNEFKNAKDNQLDVKWSGKLMANFVDALASNRTDQLVSDDLYPISRDVGWTGLRPALEELRRNLMRSAIRTWVKTNGRMCYAQWLDETCRNCGLTGHVLNSCPANRKSDVKGSNTLDVNIKAPKELLTSKFDEIDTFSGSLIWDGLPTFTTVHSAKNVGRYSRTHQVDTLSVLLRGGQLGVTLSYRGPTN